MIHRLSVLPSWLRERLGGASTSDERFMIPGGLELLSGNNETAILIEGKPLIRAHLLGVSKSGNPSWSGYWDNIKVKIYRAFNADQSRFIEVMGNHPALGNFFPHVLFVKNEYVVVEWVEGESLNESKVWQKPQYVEEMARMQTIFHNTASPAETHPGFDYTAHLLQRLERYRGPLPLSDSMLYLLQIVERGLPVQGMKVSHADVTLKNLVREKSAVKLKLIDNEFLTISHYYWIDLFNTYRSLRHLKSRARQYVESYLYYGGDLKPILENSPYFLALWGLRMIVTTMQAGDVERAYQLADQMFSGKFETHPLISLIGEIVK